ncbi:MAG: FtsX-like permease family protein, partial [Actinomycetota bacterium]|nr:FtsX-like permease family protein [Actinomycetota bacterium]
FGTASFGATAAGAATWMAVSALAGLVIAAVAVLIPARRSLREATVAAGRSATARAARRRRLPLVLRLGTDLWLLAGAAVVYAITSRQGYSLVLAPEGVPTISVSYWAFAGPAMFWAGTALLTWRIVDLVLRRGRRLVTWAARPLSGALSGLAAATASRQRSLLARSSVIAGLALIFAASTAVFNSTYKAQASVDARLTNGADVAVTNPPGTQIPPDTSARIAATPGVNQVEPLIHRYAYIGPDLQDLYSVRPATITKATTLQDAYFSGGTAQQLIARLAARPDSVLVSAETVKDYQLHLGDPLTLRLQDAHTQRLIPVVFHYAGVVKEFPTAPHDSFFVTNASYVAQASGDAATGTFLVNTTGHPHQVAGQLRAVLGQGPAITDIATTRTAVGSSLTAVDLAGLTRVELGFGLVLAVAGGGLVLGLGLAERRRDLAVVAALGARRSQLRALVQVDTVVVTVAALVAGTLGGAVLAEILVKVLTGVFDPPPASLSVPWPYLLVVAGLAVAGISGATRLVATRASHRVSTSLREL